MTTEPRYRTEALAGILGAAVLAAASVALVLASPPAAAGDVPVPAVAGDTSAPSSIDLPTTRSVAPSDLSATAASSTAAGTGAERVVDDPAPAAPTGLSLPRLGVEAPVIDAGLEADGGMEVPHDVHEVGWYEPGPAPGEPGSAVIAGHVDGRGQGPGAFWDLRSLEPGDTFELDHADGTTTTWQIDARRRYRKDALPLDELFTREGPPRVALITCGGAFDRESGGYQDNVVVYATPPEGDAGAAG